MERKYPLSEYSRRGDRIFHEKVAPTLENVTPSRFVAIDVDSEDFVVHADEREAISRLKSRRPQAQTWLRRTDSPAVYSHGRSRSA